MNRSACYGVFPWMFLCLACSLFFAACIGGEEDSSSLFEIPDSLRTSPSGGPTVFIDPLAEHTPEIPFPNDLATVIDLTSPTGRRLNVRAFAPTVFEETVRGHLNELDGFGTFAPIYVSFGSRPQDPCKLVNKVLDLKTVKSDVTRLGIEGANTVLLVDLGPDKPYWGNRFVPLDARNNANFPIHIETFAFPSNTYSFPPYAYKRLEGDSQLSSYYVPPEECDSDQERVDEQLVFHPLNREDLDGDGEEEILTSYEIESNTLIMRPVIPLRQATEYLMVLTKGMKGKNGHSISSPYPYVAHAAQIKSLQKGIPYLREVGVAPEDIAFAWTFTTQSVTPVLEAVRDGMDGKGTLSHLARKLPFELDRVGTVDIGALEKDGNPYLLNTDLLNEILTLVVPLIPELQGAPLHFDYVDYIVMGSFKTPNFRATPDEVFDIDLNTGQATVGEEEVPFLLCVPKSTEKHQPPFPVTLYCHGNQSIRFEAIASADYLAQQGIAVMGIDAVGHGPILNEKELLDELEGALEGLGLPDDVTERIELFALSLIARLLGIQDPADTVDEVMQQLLSVGFLNEVLVKGRAIDLSGDGYPDNGANFWTADTFKTRDVVRQTVIDLMYLLRILKNMDQAKVPTEPVENPAELEEEEANRYLLAGDFNMDNVLDVGGVDNVYYQSGISLGGIVSSIMIGAEPSVRAGVPVVPGGGLTDVMLRSNLKDVMYRIYYEVLGPAIFASPRGDDGTVSLWFQNNLRRIETNKTLRVEPGGTVHGINPRNGEQKTVTTKEVDGSFLIGVAADEGDIIRLTSYSKDKVLLDQVELVSPLRGFGLDRNTPRFRRFVSLAQITMEPGDPINYAQNWFMNPLSGAEPKNLLQLTDPGDLTVPINNQIALARAGGLLGDLRFDMAGMLERNDKLIARQVLLGHDLLDPDDQDYVPFPLYDVEDRDQNNLDGPSAEWPPFTCEGEDFDYCTLVQEDMADPFAPLPPVDTGRGRALVRFPHAKKHEFFGIPKNSYYSIYTVASQDQAGAFLGSMGQEWSQEWDCMIDRIETVHPDNPEWRRWHFRFAEECPWQYEIQADCTPKCAWEK